VNLTFLNTSQPVRALPRRLRQAVTTRSLRQAVTGSLATASMLMLSAAAFAQGTTPTSPTGGIGEQLNLLSGEAINSGGTAGGMAMYGAALMTFIAGVWAIWKSRQPQNREGGHMAMGVAGLVLCGLFATGGTWINKAAHSASGGAATANGTAQVVQFK